MNLDGHEGREEQDNYGEGEKSQNLPLAVKWPHTSLDTALDLLVPKLSLRGNRAPSEPCLSTRQFVS